MEGKEEKILRALKDKEEKYPCVWYPNIICPIRSRWKLAPENLTPWCTVCKDIGYLDEARSSYKEMNKLKRNASKDR